MSRSARHEARLTKPGVLLSVLTLLLGCGEDTGGGAGICGNLLCEEGERSRCADCDNLPATECGDGLCQNGETTASCSEDCASLAELFGEWRACDPFDGIEDAATACQNQDFVGASRIDADGVLFNPGYGDPCWLSSIEAVAGVIEVRTCEPRVWTSMRALATRAGPYLTFYHAAEGSYVHHERNPTPDTVPVAQCDDVEGGIVDARCDALPRVEPGVAAAIVGAWQKCASSSDEPSASAACALGTRDQFLILPANGVAQLDCGLVEAEVTDTQYTFRACDWFFLGEFGLRGSVLLSSDETGEYLRIDDPFQVEGFDHYVRVDLATAEAACPTVNDGRCEP